MDSQIARLFAEVRLVPVVTLDRAEDAVRLGSALKAGGLPCAEVTFRTAAAEEALRRLAQDEDMLVGAGTVLRAEQVDQARAAGARFIVSPGFSPRVVQRCLELSLAVFPGVATPTEVQMALDAGIEVMKFFPAEASGGANTLRALGEPFPMVRFIPTGGVNPRNLASYLALPSVLAVGGSWMVARDLVTSESFETITELTRTALELVKK
jgi:2-dehydro-3-deoxyphosphogluconate aldolase/(4S)-4-hydroxy-2-oxoglutarate aldolase